LKRFQKDSEQGVLCMEKCFEDMKSQGVRERENILYLIGALLATVLSLKHSNVEST
jgi:predicted nucleic acid-binding Zn ribbon protein